MGDIIYEQPSLKKYYFNFFLKMIQCIETDVSITCSVSFLHWNVVEKVDFKLGSRTVEKNDDTKFSVSRMHIFLLL